MVVLEHIMNQSMVLKISIFPSNSHIKASFSKSSNNWRYMAHHLFGQILEDNSNKTQ